MSDRTTKLIGTFAGYQIQASENLRDATNPDLSDEQKLMSLSIAKTCAGKAMQHASNTMERALAYSQLTCATGMVAIIELGIDTVQIGSDGL